MASATRGPPLGRYQPLNFQAQEIRLLTIDPAFQPDETIVCRTSTTEITQAPAYQALSYVWGDAKDTKDITLNGVVTPVTTNLYAALLAIRARQARAVTGKGGQAAPQPSADGIKASVAEPTSFWIDAVCIDQDSTDEKNHQVPLMGEIYGRADLVLMWLGECDDQSVVALDFVRQWMHAIDRALKDQAKAGGDDETFSRYTMKAILDNKYMADPFDLEAFEAVGKLFDRPYWGRVWIVQEIVLARKALILFGRCASPSTVAATQQAPADEDEDGREAEADNECMDYDQLRRVLHIWGSLDRLEAEGTLDPMMLVEVDIAWRSPGKNATGRRRVVAMEAINSLRFEQFRARKAGEAWPPANTSALSVVSRVRQAEATDPRDKIYGAYGLLGAGATPPLRPDYALSVEETYTRFAAGFVAATGRLSLLGAAGIGSHDAATPTAAPGLPSWVPDFSIRLVAGGGMPTLEEIDRRADRGAPATSWRLSPDQRRLTVRGVRCDDIAALATGGENMDAPWRWYQFAQEQLLSRAAARRSADGDGEDGDEDGYLPGGIPWRQAYFRTIMCDPCSASYGQRGFPSPDHADWFFTRAEGFFAVMWRHALVAASARIDEYEAETGRRMHWVVRPRAGAGGLEPGELDPDDWRAAGVDAGRFPARAAAELTPEVLYWLRNSFDNSDAVLRAAALDAFIGRPGSENRLDWPFANVRYPLCFVNKSSENSVLFDKFAFMTRSGRAFAVTVNGYFALVPEGARVGDAVYVVHGYNEPVLLRRVPCASGGGGGAGDFVLVGSAFVCGMMEGEMIKEAQEGRLPVEDLTLV